MYVESIPNRKSPPAILVRECYRKDGKVIKRTISNISKLPQNTIDAIKATLAGDILRNNGNSQQKAPSSESGPVFAVLEVLNQLAGKVGINKALGNSRIAQLTKFLILARIAHQGSRLSAVRWAQDHAVEEVLALSYFDQNDLYEALDWVADNQEKIEKTLYRNYVKEKGTPPALVLYDVTSSYLEGEQNELAVFGYNRDGKKGKKQIVIGLLTSPEGDPLSVEVFEGNTGDPSTVINQIKKIVNQFKIEEVVFVGDRGMVKAKGKIALKSANFKYITALTDPQVRTLIKKSVIQPGLFDEDVVEIEHNDKRLVLRRDDLTQRKEAHRRNDKLTKLKKKIIDSNEFVLRSKKADPSAGLNSIEKWTRRHKLSSFINLSLEGKTINWHLDEEAKKSDALLDGCYVLESNVSNNKLSTQNVHDRYRDLQKVGQDFRTMKTTLLEIRPIFVRKEKRTKGHVFISMLALKIARLMRNNLQNVFGSTDDDPKAETIESSLTALSRLCLQYYDIDGNKIVGLPIPDARQQNILDSLNVSLKPPKMECTQ